jgi:hypothetical protein
MRTLRLAAPCALVVWLLICLLPSHSMGEFAHRAGSDAGYVVRVTLVALSVFGIPYLIFDAIRRSITR